ncbi:coiled-coil domain-containing protein [Tuwongella immobilis]|uniref:Uncharacterized protein n=1 Tax=Tuwongella immobilis TaxID=692036 RepID=A0A6C2YL84_9BACT|nr:hypothetical protein [Tuwongella immobilis]VIP02071.1 unnamed protein product [Tuwongella immobilis]VTS00300.1 unnamed protein product [Tuwongella immobilis]
MMSATGSPSTKKIDQPLDAGTSPIDGGLTSVGPSGRLGRPPRLPRPEWVPPPEADAISPDGTPRAVHRGQRGPTHVGWLIAVCTLLGSIVASHSYWGPRLGMANRASAGPMPVMGTEEESEPKKSPANGKNPLAKANPTISESTSPVGTPRVSEQPPLAKPKADNPPMPGPDPLTNLDLTLPELGTAPAAPTTPATSGKPPVVPSPAPTSPLAPAPSVPGTTTGLMPMDSGKGAAPLIQPIPNAAKSIQPPKVEPVAPLLLPGETPMPNAPIPAPGPTPVDPTNLVIPDLTAPAPAPAAPVAAPVAPLTPMNPPKTAPKLTPVPDAPKPMNAPGLILPIPGAEPMPATPSTPPAPAAAPLIPIDPIDPKPMESPKPMAKPEPMDLPPDMPKLDPVIEPLPTPKPVDVEITPLPKPAQPMKSAEPVKPMQPIGPTPIEKNLPTSPAKTTLEERTENPSQPLKAPTPTPPMPMPMPKGGPMVEVIVGDPPMPMEPLSIPHQTPGNTPMTRTWNKLGLNSLLAASLAGSIVTVAPTSPMVNFVRAAEEPNPLPKEPGASPAAPKVDNSLADLKTQVQALTNALSKLEKLEESMRDSQSKNGLAVTQLQGDVSELKLQIGDLRREMERLSKRVDEQAQKSISRSSPAPAAPANPAPAAGNGQLRLVNDYIQEVSVVVNNRTYRLLPGQTTTLTIPAGAFNYQLLVDNAAMQSRLLPAGETYTIRFHNPVN